MPHEPTVTIFHGAIVNPVSLREYEALPNAAVAVGENGDIAWLVKDVLAEHGTIEKLLESHGCQNARPTVIPKGDFLVPGFVDTHTHAPQVPNIGSGQEYELLDWLNNVTFPMEARFSSVDLAKQAYPQVVRRIINSGTTTCCYYGSLHLGSTQVLADVVHEMGQRAFVGKCNMDRNSPANYIEPSPQTSIDDTKTLISYIHNLSHPEHGQSNHRIESYSPTHSLVHPIITPRFAISCTDELLQKLGDLAKTDLHLRIQTHVSENAGEIAFTQELFPDAASYTAVYDDRGLLRDNTVLAHAVHLGRDEMELIAKRRAGISHCPTSNFNLRSGLARVGEMLDAGIKVGLGTDVSGGFSPSILTAIQHASMCSKTISLNAPPNSSYNKSLFANKQLSVPTLFYLATQGGADVCALGDRIGSLNPGKAFDALYVSTRSGSGNPALWPEDLDQALGFGPRGMTEAQYLETLLERFLFTGDDRNIRKVYVQGHWIGGSDKPIRLEASELN